MEQRSFDKSLPNLKKPFRAFPPTNSEFPSKSLIKSTDFASQSPNILPQLRNRGPNFSNPGSREKALNNSGSLLTEVEKDVVSMDVNARMRDLENKFLDFKSNFEKRVLIMLEENPQKYLRHIKALEDKDAALWKESFSKQQQISEEMRETKQFLHKQGGDFFEKLLALEAKVQDLEYKARQREGDDGTVAVFKENLVNFQGDLANFHGNNGTSAINPLESELKLLKEGLSQEQFRRDSVYKDLISLYKELNLLVHKHEHELFQRVSQQKAEISLEIASSKEEIKRFGAFKAENANNEAQLLRISLGNLEKRLTQETERRVSWENELKRAMNEKFAGFMDENVKNEKNLLENGHKSLKNIQESLSSLNQIIKSNRETLEAELASSQTSTNENFKTLSKTVDFLRESLNSKVFALENALKEQTLSFSAVLLENNKKLEDFHAKISKETHRNERIIGVFEQKLAEKHQEISENFRETNKNLENWKKTHEGKSQEVFKEMHAVLKNFRETAGKDRAENEEKLASFAKNQENFKEIHAKLLRNLEEKLDSLQSSWEYKFKELNIAKQSEIAAIESKIEEKAAELSRFSKEIAEKLVTDNIYSLNQKLTLEFQRENEKTQGKFERLLEKTRETLLQDVSFIEKKAEKLANTVREELIHKNLANFKQIQELFEICRVSQEKTKEKLKEMGLNLEEKTQFLRNSFESQGVSLRNELKETLLAANELQTREFKGLLSRNSEETAKKLKEIEGFVEKSLEMRDFSLKSALRDEFSKEFGEIEEKFAVFEKNLENSKKILLETVEKRAESTKSLCKALIFEESAKREKALDDLLGILRKNVENLEKLLENRVRTLESALRTEFLDKLREIESELLEFARKNEEKLRENREIMQKYVNFLCAETLLDRVFLKQRDAEFEETVKNIEIRVLKGEDATNALKARVFEDLREVFTQLQGNRDVLWANSRKIKENIEVLKSFAGNFEEVKGEFARVAELHGEMERDGRETKEQIAEIHEILKENAENISKNTENISKNTENITKNTENIHKNTENINKNTENINKNTENIHKNTEDINKNAENIHKNSENINKNTENITKNATKLQKIEEELDGNQANLYELDEKLSKTFEKLSTDADSLNYLNDLYSQLQNEQFLESESYLRSKINKTSYQIAKIMEKIEENDRIFDEFENKTDNNFQISEQVIKAHTKFLNEIDARLTLEELFNKVCHRGLEENLRKSVGVLNQQIESLVEKQSEGFNGNLKDRLETIKEIREIEERFKEDVKNLNEKQGNLRDALVKHANFLNEIDAKLTQETLVNSVCLNGIEGKFNKEIAEVQEEIKVLAEQNLGDLEDKMKEMMKKIEEDTIPHTILQMDETMQKINNKAISLTDELARRTKILEEKVDDQQKTSQNLYTNQKEIEANLLLNSTIQRASEKNIMEYCRQGFEKIKEVLKELENVTIEQQESGDFEEIREDIQLLLTKINELQAELNEIRDSSESAGKNRQVQQQINELEKKFDAKINENKASFQETNKKAIDILAKLQVEFEKLKSQIYVNRE